MSGGGLWPMRLLVLAAAATLVACSSGGPEAVNSSSPGAASAGSRTTATSRAVLPPRTSLRSLVPSASPVPTSPPAAAGTGTSPAEAATTSAVASDNPAADLPTTDAEPDPAVTAATAATATPGGFSSSIAEIDDALAARMGSSWHSGCPVPLADLRYLTVTYHGFDGSGHPGELVVAASVAPDVVEVFHRLYDNGFAVRSLRLVDDFGGSDEKSMDADNSSAFNCRPVTGGGGFSEHSYGTAIDLNPVENPYLGGDTVLPAQGREYLDRTPAPGVITAEDQVVAAFAAIGWTWGGTWTGPVDYQHFSASGH